MLAVLCCFSPRRMSVNAPTRRFGINPVDIVAAVVD